MFHQPEDDFVSSARYYATPQEQKILIQGLQRYFSLPERSQNRNKIAKEVSMILRVYSPHWTHRAVRLWFNNNKHTYLPTIPGVGNVVGGGNMMDNGNANNNMNMNPMPMKNPMNNYYSMNMNPNLLNGIAMNPQMQIPQMPMPPFPQQMPQDGANPLFIQGNIMNNPMMQMPQYPQMGIPMVPPINQQQMQIPLQDQQMPSSALNPMNVSKNLPQKAKTIKVNKPDQSSKLVLPPISMTSNLSTPAAPPTSKASPLLSQQNQQNQQNSASVKTPIPTSPLIDSPDTVPIAKGPKETKRVTNPPMTFSNTHSPSQMNQSLNSGSLSRSAIDTNQLSDQVQQSSDQNKESDLQEYDEVCSILSEIRRIDSVFNSSNSLANFDELNSQLKELVESYDRAVLQLSARIGTLNPELVEPMANFVRIAFPIEPSTSIYNFLSSSSNMRLDSTSFSNMMGMQNDMSISYLMFPDSMSNFDLTNPMFPRMPSTPSFNQLQMGNDPSFSSFKDFPSSNSRQGQTSSQSLQPPASSTNPNTTNDGNSIVNSNSGSDSESEKEEQVKSRLRSSDQFAQPNIFQTRQYIDEKLSYFEAHALNDEYAAYTSSTLGDTQRMLYVIKYKDKFRNRSSVSNNENSNDNSTENDNKTAQSNDFAKHNLNFNLNNGNDFSNAYAVESRSVINSLAIDHDSAWMLSKTNVIKIPITQNGIPQTTISLLENKVVNDLSSLNLNFSNGPDLNSNGSLSINQSNFYEDGIIATYKSAYTSNINSGAVVCYPLSNNLFFVNGNLNAFSLISSSAMSNIVTKVPTKYSGFNDIVNMIGSDRLICSISKSSVIRMISPNGNGYGDMEERCFVGHCGKILGVQPLSENLFASRSDDQTVRIWDIRERGSGQVTTITTPHVSPISIAGNENYVICGFHNKYICVVDLRFNAGVPILGLPTQEYSAIATNYCEEDDSLTMIGVVDKDSVKDSMVFAEMSGQSRLRILRCYSDFIGACDEDDSGK